MSFWDNAIQFFWREESLLVLAVALGLALVLFHFIKDQRRSVVNTLSFFFVCMGGLFVSGMFHAFQMSSAAEMLHEAFVIGAGIALIRLWGLVIFRIILPKIRLTPPRIAEDISVILAYIVWGLVRLRLAGLDLGSIVATSAMITAVVAFAMQDTLGNILGGVALQLDNSIQIGDWIKVDDVAGRVVDIRWRSTLVETRNWETVVFPNSQLMKNKFVVLGRRTDQPVQWRRWVWFGADLDVIPSKVVNTIESTILQADIKHVAKSPAPNCVLMEIDKGYAYFALRYWLTDLAEDDPTDAAVRMHIYTALKRADIKLAVAEQRVHLTKEGGKRDLALHQRETMLRFNALRRIELFARLSEDELRNLAERLKYKPFAKGSVITRQGSAAQHWLFIIIKGDAEVCLENERGEKKVVNVLHKGDFFGEMSLMTGAPRVASVIASSDVECYRLDKEAFEEIMTARPAIADEVAQILVERREQLNMAMDTLGGDREDKVVYPHRLEMLETVKRFFGL